MGEVIVLAEHPKVSPSDRFADMLDKKLPKLESDWSRKIFLTALLHNWEARYGNFLRRCASDDPTFDPGEFSAFDYTMAISDISLRLAKYERARQS